MKKAKKAKPTQPKALPTKPKGKREERTDWQRVYVRELRRTYRCPAQEGEADPPVSLGVAFVAKGRLKGVDVSVVDEGQIISPRRDQQIRAQLGALYDKIQQLKDELDALG